MARRPHGTSLEYASGDKTKRKRILIVCEGEKTEPVYFEDMLKALDISGGVKKEEKSTVGTGRNTLSLVRYAESLQPEKPSAQYDEIWCVFDKDGFPNDQFDNAINKAVDHPFLRVAWTNQAFELWYILHFEYLHTATSGHGGTVRQYYIDRLEELLEGYQKNQEGMYDTLRDRLDKAKRNAAKLKEEHTTEISHCQYHKCVPCTTIHELVSRLEAVAKEEKLY